jgi:hypothetical protein
MTITGYKRSYAVLFVPIVGAKPCLEQFLLRNFDLKMQDLEMRYIYIYFQLIVAPKITVASN